MRTRRKPTRLHGDSDLDGVAVVSAHDHMVEFHSRVSESSNLVTWMNQRNYEESEARGKVVPKESRKAGQHPFE